MNLTIIAGARPNFIKIAPIVHALLRSAKQGNEIGYRLVHTGQHYDEKMSETFFRELNIPKPDANLGAGGGTQAEQTAAIMIAFEKELMSHPADYVLVVGDVTSTMACSITAKKQQTKVIHVEAGIRSNDITMPEEINRMVTDSITDVFFTTTTQAGEKLEQLGTPKEKIFFVGNVMIDTLRANEERFKKPLVWEVLGLKPKTYLVMTMHRPANVDQAEKLNRFISEIVKGAKGSKIIFPVHPRTKQILEKSEIDLSSIEVIDPLGYLEFNFLVKHSQAVITDSGGITEETTVMGVPCMTLRDNTERPETITIGTNELIGTNPENIGPAFEKLNSGSWKKGGIPEKWDGMAAERIVSIVLSH